MKLVPTNEIGLYDFAVGLWNRGDVDTTIQPIPGQTLLMRRVSITCCMNIEKMLALYAPPSRKTGKAPAHSAPSKRKPDHEHDPSSRVVQVPRTTQTHALYVPSSPASPASALPPLSRRRRPSCSWLNRHLVTLSLTSRCPRCHRRCHSSSPEIVVKSEPTTLSYLPKPAITSVDVDADDRWARSQVFVLSGFGTWPAGVYAQDMGPGVWPNIKWSCLG
ncbi:hypothetical protein B0H13DRAFT_2562021 [Mycena leptocephala]|nr:hypothetical protein B0H13DRAFT_2562021 [Mycena leptocephala]